MRHLEKKDAIDTLNKMKGVNGSTGDFFIRNSRGCVVAGRELCNQFRIAGRIWELEKPEYDLPGLTTYKLVGGLKLEGASDETIDFDVIGIDITRTVRFCH
jgi:hypothetical protein